MKEHDYTEYEMPKESPSMKAIKKAIKEAYAEQIIRKGLYRKGADTNGKRT
jgi:hypothetical protein